MFFWQNWLSYPEKVFATTFLLCLTLVLHLYSLLRADGAGLRHLAFTTGVLCVMALASTGWDWQRFDRTTHGVVVSPEVIARKGNSETYDPAFTEPLVAGTEFTVLERRREWLQVRIQDSGTGWLPDRDTVRYY